MCSDIDEAVENSRQLEDMHLPIDSTPHSYMVSAKHILEWSKNHIELSIVSSAFCTLVSFIGNQYYSSYYDFFYIDTDNIEITFSQELWIAIFSGFVIFGMLYVIYSSNKLTKISTRGEAIKGNLPMIVVLCMMSFCATYFYVSNVETIKVYLENSHVLGIKSEDIERMFNHVVKPLHWVILFSPLPLSILIVVIASWRKYSLAAQLIHGSILRRGLFFAGFTVLVLITVNIAGRGMAFLNSIGAIARPGVVVVLNDGTSYLGDRNLFLLGKNNFVWIITARKDVKNSQVKTWMISRQAIRSLEFREEEVNLSSALNLLVADW